MSRYLRIAALLLGLAVPPAGAQYYPPMEPMGDTTSYTALWWVPSESGWGLNTNHQGDTLFVTLFTYARDGQPMWLVGPNLMGLPNELYFAGPIYRTTGPAFNQMPWSAIAFTQVGTMTVDFITPTLAAITYSVDGVSVSKAVHRQEFGAPVPECLKMAGSRAGVFNYQDLWWNSSESGWGINMVQQGTTIFATLFTYATSGRDMWLVAPNITRQPDASYTGPLYSTRGPAFDASPWTAISFEQVGTMTMRFSAGDRATLTYTVNGTSVTKEIERQVFGGTAPACR
jgi:hypothetical protein